MKIDPGDAGQLASAIRVSTYLAYDRALRVTHNVDWFHAVEPQHLVVEISTIHHRDRDLEAVGWLMRVRREPIPIEPDDEDVDEERPTEKVWYIMLLDGRDYRWHNADFIRVPMAMAMAQDRVSVEPR